MRTKVPPPGSLEAQQAGCTCAVMDNCHGRGIGGDGKRWGWYVTGDCPVHKPDSFWEGSEAWERKTE